MHSSFIAIFVAVLAPMAVLANPHGHPPPPDHDHQGPPGLEPSGSGILPPYGVSGTGAMGAGSTGTPRKPERYRKKGGTKPHVSGVAGAGSTGSASV